MKAQDTWEKHGKQSDGIDEYQCERILGWEKILFSGLSSLELRKCERKKNKKSPAEVNCDFVVQMCEKVMSEA